MGELLRGYDVSSTTWFYLSLPLIITVYFRFLRIWSLRNLDLTLLLLLSPSVLLMRYNHEYGQIILFVVTGILMVRLFVDSVLKRRPYLQPNLNTAGLIFLGTTAFAFLMTIAAIEAPSEETIATVRRGKQLLDREDVTAQAETSETAAKKQTDSPTKKVSDPVAVSDEKTAANDKPLQTEETPPAQPLKTGPASSWMAAAAGLAGSQAVTDTQQNDPETQRKKAELIAARVMAIFLHCAIIAGLFIIGHSHFSDWTIGLSMATLYLLIPCTAFDVSAVNHVLPPALILWAFVAFRKPAVAGVFMGLACGTLLFPIFLLPLWLAYYGKKNAIRFGTAVAIVTVLLTASIAFISADLQSFVAQTFGAINWNLWELFAVNSSPEIGDQINSIYRLPLFACYLVLLVFLTIWPRQKNLEHLISHSAALVVGTQFWYPQQTNVYVLWYLPLLLLVIFRPAVGQLKDRETDSIQKHDVVHPKHPTGKPPVSTSLTSSKPLFR